MREMTDGRKLSVMLTACTMLQEGLLVEWQQH